ncbi:MAG: SDR family oxidoreductase [Alicyclobacillus sp.]|nr:SDR family oxidoreductase [Alicyclobacillus sp.]
MEMAGKRVVITGGRRGLGAAMARRLAEAGAVVVATSRQAEPETLLCPPTDGDLERPGTVLTARLDVTDEASVERLFRELESRFPRIDVWVNNAGVGVFKPVAETTAAEWDLVMNTNVRGLFLCSRAAFVHMRARGGGRIINIASVAGYQPIPENGVYGASKYAVRGFSQILNEEGKDVGVRVSVVSPGAVYTDIWAGREGFDPADMLQPEDVAQTVLDIACRPLRVRIDEVKIVPPKGVL